MAGSGDRPKRALNSFMLFRKDQQARVTGENPHLASSQPEVSKLIGKMWREAPVEIKNHYIELAKTKDNEHRAQYPDYVYQPVSTLRAKHV
jgi:hypothetical protein